MRGHFRYLGTALGLLAIAGTAFAQSKKNEIDSEASSENAKGLIKEINWNNTPPQLTKQAQAQGKLIFYMHILGSIAGNT